MISREKLANEIKVRKQISRAIRIVQGRLVQESLDQLKEEILLREIVQNIIVEAATEEPEKAPHPSTGINVLEGLLKVIIPILEDDYKSLTTEKQQRDSYRGHIIHAIRNTLAPIKINDKVDSDPEVEEGTPPEEEIELSEDVDVDIIDQDEQDKFIDIDGDGKPDKEEVEVDPKEEFGIDGEWGSDNTGRDRAYDAFKKIENQIVDTYSTLGNIKDQEAFYDYLITNVKLYFDKFEAEMTPTLEEPTTPEYEQEKSALGADDSFEQPSL